MALAQSKWTLTTADFRSKQVDLASIDDRGATFADKSAVRFDDLLLLDRELDPKQQQQAAGAGGGKFVLALAGGEQFRGEPLKLEGETLQWSSPALGAVQVRLRQVTSFTRAAAPSGATAAQPAGQAPAADEPRTEDVITLANGDSLRGIVTNVSAEGVTVQAGGTDTPVPLDGIRSVQFASTAGAAAAAAAANNQQQTGRAFRVRLDDGSVITAPHLRTAATDTLVLTLADRSTRNVALDSVASIEQLNGPVSWLSSRTPAENVQTPLLDTPRPARMDRTVTGRPIRFGERAYTRGIGVAPYSRITWAIDEKSRGDYQTFRTQYAIDGAGQYADVTVRVKLDDKLVHERQKFTAGEISPVVLVPLGSAKTLTLEVDFGGNYGVQDRFNWIEPALVKGSGAPPASPAPAATRPATAQPPAPAPAPAQ